MKYSKDLEMTRRHYVVCVLQTIGKSFVVSEFPTLLTGISWGFVIWVKGLTQRSDSISFVN